MTNNVNQDFEKELNKAAIELTLQYYDSEPENIYALVKYGNVPLLRFQIIDFIASSFDKLRKEALDYKIAQDKLWNDGFKSSVMVNHVVFGALARIAGMFGAKELAPLLYKEFCSLKKTFYELQLERGTLAIALSVLGYDGDIQEMKDILDDAVSNEFSIDENTVKLEMFYAYCILKKDSIRAIDYLSNLKRTKNLALVAATLADLDVKEALPILKDRFKTLTNHVEEEAFLEAIHRLEVQTSIPSPNDRMIWMFGKCSSTEMALGEDSDNVFVLRAIEKYGDPDLDD
jgi:hypothetical protein